MSHSDIILMVMGVALIIAGSVLFITGKQAGGKNKIKALGIEMDVSNPSLVLIIFGILLLLAPRLMPENGKSTAQQTDFSQHLTNEANNVGTTVLPPTSTPTLASPPAQAEPVPSKTKPTKSKPIKSKPQPSLQGDYDLITYSEDGITVNAEGQLFISPAKGNIFPFTGSIQAYIDWATTISFQYTGYIAHRGNKWFLKIDSASDPEWVDRGEVNMKLIRDGDTISMKYYYDADIYTVWQH